MTCAGQAGSRLSRALQQCVAVCRMQAPVRGGQRGVRPTARDVRLRGGAKGGGAQDMARETDITVPQVGIEVGLEGKPSTSVFTTMDIAVCHGQHELTAGPTQWSS